MANGDPVSATHSERMSRQGAYEQQQIAVSDPSVSTSALVLREVSNLDRVITTRIDEMAKAIVVFNENLTRVPTDVDKQVQALKELLFTRLGDMDRAILLSAAKMDLIPVQREHELGHLKDVVLVMLAGVETKFEAVQTEFILRDERVKQTATDNKVAVDAAFAAQKEAAAKQDEANQKAIDKSEKTVNETLLRQEQLFRTTTDGIGTQVTDMKERLSRAESRQVGDSLQIAQLVASVATLTTSMNEGSGRHQNQEQHQTSNSFVLALVVAAMSFIGLVVLLIKDFAR